jgi:hypothetical protein
MERFFDLAQKGDGKDRNPPAMGMITANSFMKREFGKSLSRNLFQMGPRTLLIRLALHSGHGTPTVILFGKHQTPVAQTIRAVMGIRGEPAAPEDPARGLVWTQCWRR